MTNLREDNLRALAHAVAHSAMEFDMDICVAEPELNVGGCIGCHAAILWPELQVPAQYGGFQWDEKALAEKLGITRQEHQLLFFPDWVFQNSKKHGPFENKTLAANVLYTFISTRKVMWREEVEAYYGVPYETILPSDQA